MNVTVVVLGPATRAVSGVATHVSHLLDISLPSGWQKIHFQIGSQGRQEMVLGKAWRLFWSPLALLTLLGSKRRVIVHANTSLDDRGFWRDAVYMLVARIAGAKIVFQIHGGSLRDYSSKGTIRRRMLRWVLSIVDHVVVLSSTEWKDYVALLGPGKVSFIPNAVEVSEFVYESSKFERPLCWELVYIGRIERVKGVFEIVEALALMENGDDVRWHLTVAGSGSAESELVGECQSLGLRDQVSFIGEVYDRKKMRLWGKSHLFVFPTYHLEGLPYSVLESLASGTPVVTTSIGGNADAVIDGETGFFVPPRDGRALAKMITKLLRSPALEKKVMSQNCRNLALEKYDIGLMEKRFRELYCEILK